MRYIYEVKDRVKVVTAGPRQGQVATVVEKWRKKVWLCFRDGLDDQEYHYEDLEPVQPYTKKGRHKAKRSFLALDVLAPGYPETWRDREVLRTVCGWLVDNRPAVLERFQADYAQCFIDRRGFGRFLKGWGIQLVPAIRDGIYSPVIRLSEETHHV